MRKKILAFLLAVLTIVSALAMPVSAASTLEEAMRDVNVYAKDKDLNYLTMNGSVKVQHYTYVRFVP